MHEYNFELSFQNLLMRELFKVARIGTWSANSNDKLQWSDETLELFGIERADFHGELEDFFRLVHPDDLEKVKKMSDFLNSEQENFHSEYRIVRDDGAIRHFRQTALVLKDEIGRPQGFWGLVQDVTNLNQVNG